MEEGRKPGLADFVLVPVLYFLGAKIANRLTVMPEGIAILWPCNAVLLAALIRFKGRGYPLFAALAFIAELAGDLLVIGQDKKAFFSPSQAVLFGFNNIAESTIAFLLLRQWKFNPRMEFTDDLAKFVLAGPVLAALASGIILATGFSLLGGQTSYFEYVRVFWFGDALGLTILTPLLLSVWPWRVHPPEPAIGLPRTADKLVAAVAVAAAGLFLVSREGVLLGMQITPLFLLPIAVYAAARFDLGKTALVVACATFVLTAKMTFGTRPFGSMKPHVAVVHAQEFIFIMSLVSLGLSAVLRRLRARRAELEASNAALERSKSEVVALNETLEQRVIERTRELQESLDHVKRLQGLLPICSWCKKVRDDKDYWVSVETYVTERADVTFSHGICPECLGKVEQEFAQEIERQKGRKPP